MEMSEKMSDETVFSFLITLNVILMSRKYVPKINNIFIVFCMSCFCEIFSVCRVFLST